MFNRPGPRLVDTLEFLVNYINDNEGDISGDFPWKNVTRRGKTDGSSRKVGVKSTLDYGDDIEELHEKACLSGEKMYKDPRSGYSVFTSLAHKERGWCCGSGCRHCPYAHQNVVDTSRKKNALREAVILSHSKRIR